MPDLALTETMADDTETSAITTETLLRTSTAWNNVPYYSEFYHNFTSAKCAIEKAIRHF
jgi:hypothetical protein